LVLILVTVVYKKEIILITGVLHKDSSAKRTHENYINKTYDDYHFYVSNENMKYLILFNYPILILYKYLL
jgi:hypothetical protein